MRNLGFAEAFLTYGATLKNVQWSVCAEAPDGSLVVSLWEHHFLPPKDGRVVCRDRFDRWAGAGNTEFRDRVSRALASNQRGRLVISHTGHPDRIQAGVNASTVRKSFSVKEDWVGRVSRIDGEEYEFEFVRCVPNEL